MVRLASLDGRRIYGNFYGKWYGVVGVKLTLDMWKSTFWLILYGSEGFQSLLDHGISARIAILLSLRPRSEDYALASQK
jgi:hypothetical protein